MKQQTASHCIGIYLGISRIITSLLRIDTYVPEESGSSLLVMPSISLLSSRPRGQTRYVKSTT